MQHGLIPGSDLRLLAFYLIPLHEQIIDVPRLSRGNAADNLELLQFLYKLLKSERSEVCCRLFGTHLLNADSFVTVSLQGKRYLMVMTPSTADFSARQGPRTWRSPSRLASLSGTWTSRAVSAPRGCRIVRLTPTDSPLHLLVLCFMRSNEPR